jgi:hypothetical protein
MFIEAGEQSFTFSRPTTWDAVRASGLRLLQEPCGDREATPLRVVCALRATEDHHGKPCVRIDYLVEARWSPPRGKLGWHRLADTLDAENEARACVLFAETEDEALVIDQAIEKILGLAPGTVAATVTAGGGL